MKHNNDIQLYLYDCEKFSKEKLNYFEILLNPSELTRYNAISHQENKKTFLCGRALIRLHLSKKLDLKPDELVFNKNNNGKPYLQHPNSTLTFNISHSGNFIALALSGSNNTNNNIGVDVELSTRDFSYLKIAEQYFSTQEQKALNKLPKELQKEYFLQLWTLKETFIKTKGAAIAKLAPNKLEFLLGQQKIIFNCNKNITNDMHYNFWQYSPLPQVILSLCYESISLERIPKVQLLIDDFDINSNEGIKKHAKYYSEKHTHK